MAAFPGKLFIAVTTVAAKRLSRRRSALRPPTTVVNINVATIAGSEWQILSSSFRDRSDFVTFSSLLPPDATAALMLVSQAAAMVLSNWGTERGADLLCTLLNKLIHLPATAGVLHLEGARDFLGLESALRVVEFARNPALAGFEARASAPEIADGYRLVALKHVARPLYAYDEYCLILWCPLNGQIYAAARRYTDYCNAMTATEELRRMPQPPRCGDTTLAVHLAPFPSKQPSWRSRSAVAAERIPMLKAWLESVAAVPVFREGILLHFLGRDGFYLY